MMQREVGDDTRSEMSETVDVVVVGAGAVGASAAYHLAAAGVGSVLVLEREPVAGTGSTGRCAGGFRHQFSSRVNIALSLASIPLIVNFEATHGLPLDVSVDGYVFVARSDRTWSELERSVALQHELGVRTVLLHADELADLVPGLALDGVRGATYCPDDGVADPSGLTLGYLTAARRHRAEVRFGCTVERLRIAGHRVVGVRLSSGEEVAAGLVVNAAGPWAGPLAATAGLDLPVRPLARAVAVTGDFAGRPTRRTLVVDSDTGFYFHREGEGVLMGMGAADERPGFDWAPGEEFLAGELLPTAVSVFPPLAEAGLARTWHGYYEMSPDAHPVLGPVEGLAGLLLANGFSGHGFQHAPIVGQLLAEWVLEGRPHTVDVTALTYERFLTAHLLEEHAVV